MIFYITLNMKISISSSKSNESMVIKPLKFNEIWSNDSNLAVWFYIWEPISV